MGSYVQSDYLAKLLLPKQRPGQDVNIKVKENLASQSELEESNEEPLVTKSTDWLGISNYAKLPGSWSEMDFTKGFFSKDTQEQTEKPEQIENQEDDLELPDYSYLDPENMDLEYDFELCDTLFDNTAIYTIHVCGYSISTDCDQPFIKYLMELYGEKFVFPHFDFTCPSNVNNTSKFFKNIWNTLTGKRELQINEEVENEHQDDDRTPGHTYLLNECFKRILSVMNANDHSDPDLLKNMYKGFIRSTTEPNVLYVFFDFADLTIKSNEFHRSWAIMDEILFLKEVLGFSIEPKITKLFKENPGLSQIIDKNGFIIDNPYSLYICKNDDLMFVNVYSDDVDGEFSPLEERCAHSKFGDFYMFSLSPIDMQSKDPHFKIKRYAGFARDTVYILKNVSNLTVEEEDGYNYGSIYFQENIVSRNGTRANVPFFIIKSSDDFCEI
jgi:hypothetical protein